MSNMYTYSVPFTEQELHDDYVNKVMSQQEVADKWGVTRKVVWRALHKMGIPTRKAYKRNQRGANNSSWKGGRTLSRHISNGHTKNGYYLVKRDGHPHANKAGYVAEHILVALENANLDRLPDNHCVHHINEVKTDNRPENLVICSNSKHGFYHASITPLIKQLLDKGIIAFDLEKGYVLKGVISQ